MATPAQLAANQLNAQKSTGSRSVEGKAASSRNALKHGIDAESVIIPGEHPEALEQMSASYYEKYDPEGEGEIELVETLIRSAWLKRRYMRLEAAIVTALMAAHPDDPNALGTIYVEAKPSSALFKAGARLDAATRAWFRAHKDLQKLQSERILAALHVACSVGIPDRHTLARPNGSAERNEANSPAAKSAAAPQQRNGPNSPPSTAGPRHSPLPERKQPDFAAAV